MYMNYNVYLVIFLFFLLGVPNCLLGKCYKMFTVNHSVSWYEAEKFCAEAGGHLPSINSDLEWKLIKNIIMSSDLFISPAIFIGLNTNYSVRSLIIVS